MTRWKNSLVPGSTPSSSCLETRLSSAAALTSFMEQRLIAAAENPARLQEPRNFWANVPGRVNWRIYYFCSCTSKPRTGRGSKSSGLAHPFLLGMKCPNLMRRELWRSSVDGFCSCEASSAPSETPQPPKEQGRKGVDDSWAVQEVARPSTCSDVPDIFGG